MFPTVDLPHLATSTPLWLGLLAVFTNAIVGAARAKEQPAHPWDGVGLFSFALVMGLGGGVIRDVLLGTLPVQSLRTPWALLAVAGAVGVVVALGRHLVRLGFVMAGLDALALGLFAVTGSAATLSCGLPWSSAILVGTASAVGGGILVSILQGQVPGVLVASTPQALVAALGSIAFVALAPWSSLAASFVGVAVVIAIRYLVEYLGITTRPTAPIRPDRPSLRFPRRQAK